MHARMSWGLALAITVGAGVVVLVAAGCGDDDDGNQLAGRGAGNPPSRDAGPRSQFDAGAIDAGPALEELGLDGSTLASELAPEEAQQLCHKLDEAGALLDDLDKACAVEAYLITYDAADCASVVEQCTANGFTMLGLELALHCSDAATKLTGCDAPIADVIECASVLGAFWSARECEAAALADPGPTCTEALAKSCPLLFGSASGS